MAAGVNVLMKMSGGEALRKALKKKEKEFFAAMANELPQEAQKLMQSANALAPRDTGELAGSSSVTSAVQPEKGRVRVAAAYLDEKAAAVHEGVHFGRHIEGTRGFKFYERALNAFEGGFVERIGAKLKRLVGGGP